MTVGLVAAFLQYAGRFFRPIQDLSEKYNLLQGAVASTERIFRLLDTKPEIVDVAQPVSLPSPGRGEIEFRDVWFHYGSPSLPEEQEGRRAAEGQENWVLRGVSFRIQPGERVAVVGATGSGKSTIINLLMRFYEPQRGAIHFDGVPISSVPIAELRSRIGLVLQDVFLFSEEIATNIRMGREELSLERVVQAAERIGADSFIRRLPAGYEQRLGERGSSISVGERQLVSFVRALVFDPLVLVLDEATSSVDSELEARIENALAELMKGRSTLVVAHRLSTIQEADQILVLHRGEIRERGTHLELLKLGGLYARLYELQFASSGRSDDARSAAPPAA
jgi:ATP-binding cassette subfamily B protein